LYASDKNLVCQDCNQEFVFSASEQAFFAERQFSEPRRCPSCRAARKAQRGDGAGGGGSPGRYRPARARCYNTCSNRGGEARSFRLSGAKPVTAAAPLVAGSGRPPANNR
jgi:hypothetical protein